MEGANLPAPSRALVFNRLVQSWDSEDVGYYEFRALLQLNQLAREQFISDYLRNDQDLQRRFLSFWAGMELCGDASRFESSWQDTIDRMRTDAVLKPLVETDNAVANWLATEGVPVSIDESSWSHVVCRAPFGWVPGVAWIAAERAVRAAEDRPVRGHGDQFVISSVDSMDRGQRFPAIVAQTLARALSLKKIGPFRAIEIDAELRPYTDFIAYVACLLYENNNRDDLLDQVAPIWSGKLLNVREVREWKLDDNRLGRPPEDTVRAASEVLQTLPNRIRRWMLDRDSLVSSKE